jgi:3-methyl-2-oxobutanoate hydroxymethyltransferase
MGHVGLTPQSAASLGGYRVQGRNAERAMQVLQDALDLQAAGCFAIVFEAVPAEVTDLAMPHLDCLVIGIGAGRGTDGQVLVLHDLLAMHEGHVARFVRQFADVRAEMRRGLTAYAEAVRSGEFPMDEHSYTIPREEMDLLRARWAARQASQLDAPPG